jgi:hypothetical protein
MTHEEQNFLDKIESMIKSSNSNNDKEIFERLRAQELSHIKHTTFIEGEVGHIKKDMSVILNKLDTLPCNSHGNEIRESHTLMKNINTALEKLPCNSNKTRIEALETTKAENKSVWYTLRNVFITISAFVTWLLAVFAIVK